MSDSTGRLEFRHYQPKSGHPDWDACLDEARALVSKVAPQITKNADLNFQDRLRDARRKARSLTQTAKNLVVNRRRYKRGDHALRPLYVIWTMLNDCNFRCSYCDNHQGEQYFDIPNPDRLDTAQGKSLLDVMLTGTPAIYWCGGRCAWAQNYPTARYVDGLRDPLGSGIVGEMADFAFGRKPGRG